MGGWVEILFPISEIDDPQTRAWFVDGGANQSWSNIFGSGGSFAPGAVPHQIGTDTVLQFTPPPPPAPPAPPQCLANFQWGSNYIPANGLNDNLLNGTSTNQLDQFGNFWVQADKATLVFNPSGAVIASLTALWLWDAIDAWFGSAIVTRGSTPSGIATNNGFAAVRGFIATPILQGQYIIAFVETGHNNSSVAYWYVILQPSATGNPTVLGAVYYTGLLGPPYTAGPYFLGIANNQTIDDPILFRGDFALGASQWAIIVVPSISTIISGTYKTGFPGIRFDTNTACQVPRTYYYPIGNTNLSTEFFYFATISTMENIKSGFTLPNSSGGTNLYFYMSQEYMRFEAANNTTDANPEVHTVLAPAFPGGCMIKFNMGVIDYTTVATFALSHFGPASATGTGMYTVDNAAWNDGTSAMIPFADEHTYLSNGSAGGNDAYVMQPGAVIDRGNGIWWIIFYMPGITETEFSTGNPLYEAVRVFQYDTRTEVATQLLRAVCVLYTQDNIPLGKNPHEVIADWFQAWSISDAGGLITLHVNGYRQDGGLTGTDPRQIVYKTDFLQFTP